MPRAVYGLCYKTINVVNETIHRIILYAYWDQVLMRIHRNRCLGSRRQEVNILVGLQ
jgi:hypothetical protein